jgi:predicted DCC family thiol-disulfide oxidoreductase YuxK
MPLRRQPDLFKFGAPRPRVRYHVSMAPLPLVYDADCGFCRTLLAAVLAWDARARLRPIALQDPEAAALLAAVPEAERERSWHLILPGGAVRSGGHAFAPLLRLLPGGRPLAALPAAAPGLADRAYHAVADRRGLWGPLIPARLKAWADRRIAARRAA